MTRRSRLASTYSSAGFSPSHQVATSGSSSFSPSSRSATGGRKPSHAADSSTPVPSALRHHDAAGAQRAQQSRDAERRVAAQFQRIAEIVVEAPQDGMHAAQSAQRLEEHRVAAHREVAAFDQRHAELAGEVGVFEVGLVVGTRASGSPPAAPRRRRRSAARRAARPKKPRTRRTAMSAIGSGCTCSRISRFSSA